MHIWVISQFYKPEPGNASSRMHYFAKVWQYAEQDVSILTATPTYPYGTPHEGYMDKPHFMSEQVDDVDVYRHWIYKNPTQNSKTRLLAQWGFSVSLLINFFRRHPKKPNVILVTSPPILPAFSGWLLAKRYRAKFVYEAREPWPALLLELGLFKDGRLTDFLVKMQTFLIRQADMVVTTSKELSQDIQNLGVADNNIEIVPNGFPETHLGKVQKAQESGAIEALRTELQVSPMTKIVMYMGNHSTSQALGQVVEAAKRFLSRSDVLFLFVGTGEEKQRLKTMAQGMPNILFIHSPDEEKKWVYYGLANVCLVPLKDINSLNKITPSKLFEILGAGRPCVATLCGSSADMVNEARVALVTPPEDSHKLAHAIAKLVDNPEKAEILGKKAQDWIKKSYTTERLGYTYLTHLRQLTKGTS